MTTIYARTKTALDTLGLPVAKNQYKPSSGQDLPDEYLVYQLISAPPLEHADDAETMKWYRMQVNLFYRAEGKTSPDIIGAMIAAGFMRADERDLPYNEATRHYGRSLDFSYCE